MPSPEEVRAYLRDALSREGIPYSHASKAIDRNPTYIQQYLSEIDPTPRFLSETDRQALVQAYPFLDAERLKPPLKPSRAPVSRKSGGSDRHNQSKVDSPRLRELINEPGAVELLEAYAGIKSDHFRRLALSIVQGFAAGGSSIVA